MGQTTSKQGDTGPRGLKGVKGDTGKEGPGGPKGDTGPIGPKGDKGEKGDKGDKGGFDASIGKDNVVWCADGGICSVPQPLALSGKAIRFRGGNDLNHGIHYDSDKDGPTLYGNKGGVLSTNRGDNRIAEWDTDRFNINKEIKFQAGGTDTGRQVHAGVIGYNIHGGSVDKQYLGIVGGGKTSTDRLVKIWDNAEVVNKITTKNLHVTGEITGNLDNIKGPKGDTGNGVTEAEKKNLFWCPDNGFCTQDNGGEGLKIGKNVPGRQQHAGIIGYNSFGGTDTNHYLAIVGGGTGNDNRKVKLWDNLEVTDNISAKSITIGDWTIVQNHLGFLEFKRPGGASTANKSGYVVMNKEGDVWENKNSRWISTNIGNKDKFRFQSLRGGDPGTNKRYCKSHHEGSNPKVECQDSFGAGDHELFRMHKA